MLSAVAPHAAPELFGMDQIGDLRKNELPSVHPENLARMLLDKNAEKSSSRSRPPTRIQPG
jgi:hypothetical protein